MTNPQQKSSNLYDILGVDRSSSKEEIRKAYKSAAIKYHPDKLKHDATEEEKSMFIKIQDAYEILSDDKKRSNYDTFGTAEPDMASNHFDEMSSLFNMLFKFQNNATHTANIEPIHIEVNLELSEVASGVKKTIMFERKTLINIETNKVASPHGVIFMCEKCKGAGSYFNTYQNGFMIMQNSQPCEKCKATGYINLYPNRFTFALKKCKFIYNFQKGIKNKEQITLQNLGNINPLDPNRNGNVILAINYVNPPKFKTDSNGNLAYFQTISIFEAITGTEFDFAHLDGRNMRVRIPPIMPNFQKIVKNNGLPQHLESGEIVMTDLIILFEIIYPDISADQKKIIETNFEEFYHIVDKRKEAIYLNFEEGGKYSI
jgi:DnaJ-class molecular chaperone